MINDKIFLDPEALLDMAHEQAIKTGDAEEILSLYMINQERGLIEV